MGFILSFYKPFKKTVKTTKLTIYILKLRPGKLFCGINFLSFKTINLLNSKKNYRLLSLRETTDKKTLFLKQLAE